MYVNAQLKTCACMVTMLFGMHTVLLHVHVYLIVAVAHAGFKQDVLKFPLACSCIHTCTYIMYIYIYTYYTYIHVCIYSSG